MGNSNSRGAQGQGSIQLAGERASASWRDKAFPLLLVAVELGVSVYIATLLIRKLNPSSEDAEAASVVQQRLASRLQAAGVANMKFNSYEKLAMGVRGLWRRLGRVALCRHLL